MSILVLSSCRLQYYFEFIYSYSQNRSLTLYFYTDTNTIVYRKLAFLDINYNRGRFVFHASG